MLSEGPAVLPREADKHGGHVRLSHVPVLLECNPEEHEASPAVPVLLDKDPEVNQLPEPDLPAGPQVQRPEFQRRRAQLFP